LKKKVLFIINLPPPVYGANVVGQYIKQSSLVNETFYADYINLTTEKELNNTGKFRVNKIAIFIKLYTRVFYHLIRRRYNLCYISINAKGSGFYKDFIIVVLLKLFRCRIVYHYHNKGIATVQHIWWLNKMYRFQFKNSKVILLSSRLYDDIKKYVLKENVFICANGIPEIQGINLVEINKKRNAKAIPELLYLSNMMKEKGVFVLLEACKILKARKINFRMNFVGGWVDITEGEFNDFVIKNDLGNLIAYHGRQYGEAKAKYFETADIFIFPTFYSNETFALVNLEAMQYELPVITTCEGGIPDVVSNNINGYLVEKKNPIALADKILYLIEHPETREKMGAAGRDRYEQMFNLKRFENNFVNILENLITSKYNNEGNKKQLKNVHSTLDRVL